MGMDMKERRAVIREMAKRYRRASKKQKGQLLDEVTALTGYHRAYACYLLNREGKKVYLGNRTYLQADVTKKTKRHRRRVYDERVKQALLLLWQMLGYPCGKRLAPVLPETIEALKRHGEWSVDAYTEGKLLRISASTIDRLLAPEKRQWLLKPKSHTKPGTLLKKQIPVRTFADWDEKRPGFLEADLVAHEGGNSRGEFVYSLVLVDVCTGWTEVEVLRNKAQLWVVEGMERVRGRLPFGLLGLDSDNGSEFINTHLQRYCEQWGITFTRGRAGRKNDSCYVEQKNYSLVRRYVGYGRYAGEEALGVLAELYGVLRLYWNFFQPVMQLVRKERVGSQLRKWHDKACTPYRRLLRSGVLSGEAEERLRVQYEGLNPMALHRQIVALQERLEGMLCREKEAGG